VATSAKMCDICKHPVGATFVDGKTTLGPWANMCEDCYKGYGVGLGTGRGQRFETATMKKLEG